MRSHVIVFSHWNALVLAAGLLDEKEECGLRHGAPGAQSQLWL